MVGKFLMRGMLVGLIAGLLSFGFLKIYGEPAVDRAIAFETAMDEAKAKAKAEDMAAKGMVMPKEEPEVELVSRSTQAGIGLLTGVAIYSTSFGGLFALVFALCYGRMGAFGARATAGLLALSGFVSVYVVPNLTYPANPPSVGDPETITLRTQFYFAMVLISIAGMIAAWMIRNRLVPKLGDWNAAIVSAGLYLAAMIVVGLLVPVVSEVPEAFPAVVLWQFRVASFGAQAIMWAVIGLGFGALAERQLASGQSYRRRGASVLQSARTIP